jgi:hypothetical protein
MPPARLWSGWWVVRRRLTRIRIGARGGLGPPDWDPLALLIPGDLESFPDLRGEEVVRQKD